MLYRMGYKINGLGPGVLLVLLAAHPHAVHMFCVTQVSEKQLYEAEKAFKMYESMINVMEEEVGGGEWTFEGVGS